MKQCRRCKKHQQLKHFSNDKFFFNSVGVICNDCVLSIRTNQETPKITVSIPRRRKVRHSKLGVKGYQYFLDHKEEHDKAIYKKYHHSNF